MQIPVYKHIKMKTNYFNQVLLFLKSTDFTKALLIGISLVVPIVLGILFDGYEIGLAIAFGAFWCSPSDVAGSFRHKRNGILFSAALIVLVSFIGGYLTFSPWLVLPVLGLLMFGISYLAVFGFRASMIAFSGLLALVLSFAHGPGKLEIYEHSFFIGVGGFWYLLLATIAHRINPTGHTEEVLAETVEATARYIEFRANLLTKDGERKKTKKKLLELQIQLNEMHEKLRGILITTRRSFGRSNYQRKRLLVLVELVDMLELAMATPINPKAMEALIKAYPEQVKAMQNLSYAMVAQMIGMAKTIRIPKTPFVDNVLIQQLRKIRELVAPIKETDPENYLVLGNLIAYQNNQVSAIGNIERLLDSKDTKVYRKLSKDDAVRFLSTQDYDPKVLTENLNFKSVIFGHALRLSVVAMIGFALGSYFSLQNPYWILLTIVVILRPSYGLTKARSKDRILGTLIGGAIALGVVQITQDTIVLGALGFISLLTAFSMVQRNYRAAAVFITLSVVFVYALLDPNIWQVVQFRIVDTIIGAALATLGILFLWPSWEIIGIRPIISKSILANQEFLKAIVLFYKEKGKLPPSYKIARKEAFLASANLSAAFQRMTQEPRSKQYKLDKVYELVSLDHTFLSSLASLGTFIRNQPTSQASLDFKTAGQNIEEQLNLAVLLLSVESANEATKKPSPILTETSPLLELDSDKYVVQSGKSELTGEEQRKEALLIINQLKRMYSLSKQMVKCIREI